MNQHLALTTLVVRDYDEAIAFFVGTLGFTLVEDTYQPEQDKRWVVVRPSGPSGHGGAELLLARASNDEQRSRIGNQTGGRVGFFLYTDHFDRDHARYSAAGVEFVRPRSEQPYGIVAVFKDLYGNLWDLVQLHQPALQPLTAVVYAKDMQRLAAFYGMALGATVLEQAPGYTVLQAGAVELSVVQMPAELAAQVVLTQPPEVREATPIKLSFAVPGFEQVATAAAAFGGGVKPPEAAWVWRGARHLDAADPEGNVVQFRCRAANE